MIFSDGSSGKLGLLGFPINWSLTRYFSRIGTQNNVYPSPTATYSNYNNLMQLENYSIFNIQIEEYPHNDLHGWVGGFLNSTTRGVMGIIPQSPQDPIFYFHHVMADKVWADWIKTIWNGVDYGNVYNGQLGSIGSKPTYNGTQIFDNRATKLWYAENKNVVLNKYTASHQTLGLTTGPEFYFYSDTIKVAGTATNFFTVPDGIDVKIESMTQIALLPGFSAPDGAVFGAEIISSFPLILRKEATEESILINEKREVDFLNIYPNPNNGTFTVALPLGDFIKDLVIVDTKGTITNYSRNDTEIKLINSAYGIYFVQVQTLKGKRFKSKIIVID